MIEVTQEQINKDMELKLNSLAYKELVLTTRQDIASLEDEDIDAGKLISLYNEYTMVEVQTELMLELLKAKMVILEEDVVDGVGY